MTSPMRISLRVRLSSNRAANDSGEGFADFETTGETLAMEWSENYLHIRRLGCGLVNQRENLQAFPTILSRYCFTIKSTTWSIDSAEESTCTASAAGFSGATSRVASRLSRSSNSRERAARLARIPLSINCLYLRCARTWTSAVK